MSDIPKLRKGQILQIEFLDHVEDSDTALSFIVYGRLARQQRHTLTVDSWAYKSPRAVRDHNVKSFTILKSAIVKLAILVPKGD